MRTFALGLVAASLAFASAASAGSIEMICRGTATAPGVKDQGVRFHMRMNPEAGTFCLNDCHEQMKFTSVKDGIYRYETPTPGGKVFEVRLQPSMDYRSDYRTASDVATHESGGCRQALVRSLVAAIFPPEQPWPDQK